MLADLRRNDGMLALGLALGTGVLVFATRTAQQTGDGLSYAFAVREGEGLVHPHHLLFLPVLRALYLATGGPGRDASFVLTLAQAHGAVWAAIAVAAVFLTFRGIGFSRRAAVVGAGAMSFAQGFWVLATHCSPYVPSVACLAAACAVLARGLEGAPSGRRLAAASLPWAAAVLFHQAHVVFTIPLIVSLAALAPKRAPRLAAAATVPAGATVLAVYLAAFLSTGNEWSLVRFGRFLTRYAHAGRPQWGDAGNVGWEGIGLVFRNQLWNLVAVPRAAAGAAALLFGAVVAALVGWHVLRIVRGDGHRAVRILLVAWLLAYWALFLWWVPSETKLYSLTVLPLVMLLAMALRDAGVRGTRIAAAFTVAALGVFHLLSIVLPTHAHPKAAYVEAKRIAAAVPGPCAALVGYEVAQSLRFYFGWRDSAPATAALIQAYQGRRLDVVLDVRDASCVVADLDAVLPGRETFGFDGYREPGRWLEHLEWLLDVEKDASGGVVGSRRFDGFRTAAGRSYLLVGPEREPVAGLEALCARLDDRLGGRGFLAWWETNRDWRSRRGSNPRPPE